MKDTLSMGVRWDYRHPPHNQVRIKIPESFKFSKEAVKWYSRFLQSRQVVHRRSYLYPPYAPELIYTFVVTDR